MRPFLWGRLRMSVLDWVSGRVFKFVHGNNLVYNTCWEDPRLDRVALQFQPSDNVLVITSAGCNALDYALCEPNHVYAVDMNPRQNALLDQLANELLRKFVLQENPAVEKCLKLKAVLVRSKELSNALN